MAFLRVAAGVGGAVTAVQVSRFLSRDRSDQHSFETSLTQFVMFDALRLAGAYARRAHDADCAAFGATQADFLLREVLEKNKGTAYGVDHGFEALAKADDPVAAFRASHPLTTYADVEPYVKRIYDGTDAAVMNAAGETMLAATSGTSGRVALLPTTAQMSSTFFARGILVVFDVLARGGHLDHLQRTLKLAFMPTSKTAPSGLRVGANSSGPRDKSFARLRPVLYSTPAAGYEIADDEWSALYVHCLFAAKDRDLGVLEANFCSLPARALALLGDDETNSRVAADVGRGSLDDEIAARVGPDLAARLTAALGGPDPARAAEIRAAAVGDGERGLARRLWPKLKLILSNGTGAFAPHAARLRRGPARDVPLLSTILAASEGLMGVGLEPSDDGSSAYCLVPRAMFFEFLPVDEEATHDTLLASDLVEGRDYELVVTTLGGLCRYRIGDVVTLVGRHGEAPVVEFKYRMGQVLNVRGEKTSEAALQAAVDAALPQVDVFAAIERCDDGLEAPGYDVIVAAGDAFDDNEAVDRLDDALKEANPVYKTWRDKGAISPPDVVRVSPGAFEALRRKSLEEGASPQQLKASRVLRREDHVAFLLAFDAPPAEPEVPPAPGTLAGVARWARRYVLVDDSR